MEHQTCTRCRKEFPLDHFRSEAKPNKKVVWCARCRAISTQRERAKGHKSYKDYIRPAGWCFSCKQVLPIESFYIAPSQKRGYSGSCKKCVHDTQAQITQKQRDKLRQTEEGIEKLRKRRYSEYTSTMKDPKRKQKLYARRKLQCAVREGSIIRQPCVVCQGQDTHGHHDDYSKPLEVRWLCRKHHAEHHRNNP